MASRSRREETNIIFSSMWREHSYPLDIWQQLLLIIHQLRKGLIWRKLFDDFMTFNYKEALYLIINIKNNKFIELFCKSDKYIDGKTSQPELCGSSKILNQSINIFDTKNKRNKVIKFFFFFYINKISLVIKLNSGNSVVHCKVEGDSLLTL